MALRISNNGNLIETMTGALGSKWHRVILDTSSLGDRRQRKAAARAKMEELAPKGFERPPFAVYHMHLTGIIRSIRMNITFTI